LSDLTHHLSSTDSGVAYHCSRLSGSCCFDAANKHECTHNTESLQEQNDLYCRVINNAAPPLVDIDLCTLCQLHSNKKQESTNMFCLAFAGQCKAWAHLKCIKNQSLFNTPPEPGAYQCQSCVAKLDRHQHLQRCHACDALHQHSAKSERLISFLQETMSLAEREQPQHTSLVNNNGMSFGKFAVL